MRNNDIKKIIDSVNDGSASDRIFMRPLLNNVYVAQVWPKYPDGKSSVEESAPFYFVFTEQGLCIAAICDMGKSNLHVYTLKAYRRHGLMYRALIDVVLPHLSLSRETQRTEFNRPASRRLLEKLGFTILDRSNAEISLAAFAAVDFPETTLCALPPARSQSIGERLWQASGLVNMVIEELKFYCHNPAQIETLTYLSEELVDQGCGMFP